MKCANSGVDIGNTLAEHLEDREGFGFAEANATAAAWVNTVEESGMGRYKWQGRRFSMTVRVNRHGVPRIAVIDRFEEDLEVPSD